MPSAIHQHADPLSVDIGGPASHRMPPGAATVAPRAQPSGNPTSERDGSFASSFPRRADCARASRMPANGRVANPARHADAECLADGIGDSDKQTCSNVPVPLPDSTTSPPLPTSLSFPSPVLMRVHGRPPCMVGTRESDSAPPSIVTSLDGTAPHLRPPTDATTPPSPPPPMPAALSVGQRLHRHNPYSRSQEDVDGSVAHTVVGALPTPSAPDLSVKDGVTRGSGSGEGFRPARPLASSLQGEQGRPLSGTWSGSQGADGTPTNVSSPPVPLLSSVGGQPVLPPTLSSSSPPAYLVGVRSAETRSLTSPSLLVSPTQPEAVVDGVCRDLTDVSPLNQAGPAGFPYAARHPVIATTTTSHAQGSPASDHATGDLIVHERSHIRVVVRRERHGAVSSTTAPALCTSPLPARADDPSGTPGVGGGYARTMAAAEPVLLTRDALVSDAVPPRAARSNDAEELISDGTGGERHDPLHARSPMPPSDGPLCCSAADGEASQPWWGSFSSNLLRGRGGSTRESSVATSRAASSNSSHLVRVTLAGFGTDSVTDDALRSPTTASSSMTSAGTGRCDYPHEMPSQAPRQGCDRGSRHSSVGVAAQGIDGTSSHTASSRRRRSGASDRANLGTHMPPHHSFLPTVDVEETVFSEGDDARYTAGNGHNQLHQSAPGHVTVRRRTSLVNSHSHHHSPLVEASSLGAVAGGLATSATPSSHGRRGSFPLSSGASERHGDGPRTVPSVDAPLSAPSGLMPTHAPLPHTLPYWMPERVHSLTTTPLSSSVRPRTSGSGCERGVVGGGGSGAVTTHPPFRTGRESYYRTPPNTGGLGGPHDGSGAVAFTSPASGTTATLDDYTFGRRSTSINFDDPASTSMSSGTNGRSGFLFSYGASSDEEHSGRLSPPAGQAWTGGKLPLPEAWRPPHLLVSPKQAALMLQTPPAVSAPPPPPPPPSQPAPTRVYASVSDVPRARGDNAPWPAAAAPLTAAAAHAPPQPMMFTQATVVPPPHHYPRQHPHERPSSMHFSSPQTLPQQQPPPPPHPTVQPPYQPPGTLPHCGPGAPYQPPPLPQPPAPRGVSAAHTPNHATYLPPRTAGTAGTAGGLTDMYLRDPTAAPGFAAMLNHAPAGGEGPNLTTAHPAAPAHPSRSSSSTTQPPYAVPMPSSQVTAASPPHASPPGVSAGGGRGADGDATRHARDSVTSATGRGVDPRVAAGSAPTITSDELNQRCALSHEERCPAGWHFSVYNHNMDQHYALPSEDVYITQGAVKYLQLFERHGMQTRFRFQVCRRFLSHKCDQGANCLYIHTSTPLNATRIHINENTLSSSQEVPRGPGQRGDLGGVNTKQYPTLDPGFLVEVRAPNQGDEAPQQIRSEMILRTKGSEHLVALTDAARRGGPTYDRDGRPTRGGHGGRGTALQRAAPVGQCVKKLRHCAHFQFKGVCNLGEDCSFIHSLVPYIQSR